MIEIIHGDSLDVFRGVSGLASIVSDPPGGGHFMGLAFDNSRGGRDKWIPYWADRFKVAREATERGAWGLFWAFGRTAHWTACALDDAGWEVVRPILHVYGQGWPKGDSQLKPAQEVWWLCRWGGVTALQIDRCRVRRSWAERSEAWFRSGNSAKPEAAKIAAPPGNGINIHEGGSWPPDLLLSHCPACKEVGSRSLGNGEPNTNRARNSKSNIYGADTGKQNALRSFGEETVPAWECLAVCACGLASLAPAGGAPSPCPGCGEERWWACPVAELDGQSGASTSSGGQTSALTGYTESWRASRKATKGDPGFGDSGGASRFFPSFHYDAKASRAERQAGCDGLLWVRDKGAPIGWRRVTHDEIAALGEDVVRAISEGRTTPNVATGNVHATIKPVGAGTDDGLMRWLVRLITPPGGRVGDITMGSGSTALASQIEGHDFVGGDIDAGAVDITRARTAFWTPEMHRHVLREAEALRAAVKREKPAAVDDIGPLFAGRTA